MTPAPGQSEAALVPNAVRPKSIAWTRGMIAFDLRSIALVVVTAVVYAAVARVSLLFVLEPQHVAGIWPPAGIAVASLLLTRRASWPAILAGVAIAVGWANLVAGVPIGLTAGFILANTIEPALAAWALQRAGFTTLASLRGVGLFLAYAVIGGPAVSALLGAIVATLGAGAPLLPTYATWLLSDAGGVLAVAPLILLLGGPIQPIRSRRVAIEALSIAVLVIGTTCLAFLPQSVPVQLAASPIFLFLVLAALRFEVAGATLATFAVSTLATAGTIAGHGPFVRLNQDPAVHIGQVQILIATVFLISFVTAAVIRERRMAAAELHAQSAVDGRRAATNERITEFARSIARTLDPDALFVEIARAIGAVVPADVVALSVREPGGTGHRITAAVGAPDLVGRTVEAGDGPIGAVILDGRARILAQVDPGERAIVTRDVLPGRPLAVACVPVVVDGSVAATLALARADLTQPFSPDDAQSLGLLAELAAIALRNAVAYSHVQDLSIRDELTGVPNRRYFAVSFEQLSSQRERQASASREPVSIVLFDLDHFGAVNKERGHTTGDRVLAAFGGLLASRLRRADIVARYGGEEFVAVLVGAGREAAMRVADEIRTDFAKMVVEGEDGEPIHCTVSAGVASLGPDDPATITSLLPSADVALSMAKRAGRNMVCAV